MSNASGIGAPLAESVLEPPLTQLLRLFPSRGNSLIKRVGSLNWRQMSQFHYLTDEEIAASIEKDAVYVRATTLDDMTKFLVITVPANSRYIDLEQFARLIAFLRALHLNPKVYRAADSEDIQVFLSFTETANTAAVLRVLNRELTNQSFEIAAHSLVVHSTYEPFALPLQSKFAWLNDDLSVKVSKDDIAVDAAIAFFLADMTRAAVSPAVLLDRPVSPVSALNASTDTVSDEPVEFIEAIDSPVVLDDTQPALYDQAPEIVLATEQLKRLGGQLQLFVVPSHQEPKEQPTPVRRSRKRRPRSDPQAPRAEPVTNNLFPTITTDNFSSSDHQKEANQRD